jgi:hypothetical protein
MVITRGLYRVVIEDYFSYNVVADSLDEAISIMRKWRKDCKITSVNKSNDDIVLTKEDVQ